MEKIKSFSLYKFKPRFKIFESFLNFSIFLLCIFLIYFPKGGFKISNIPITWGYLLLGIFSIFAVINLKSVSKNHIYAFLATVPFFLLVLFYFFFKTPPTNESVIVMVTNAFILPFIFFIIFPNYLEKVDKNFLYKIIKNGILFVSIYGIFLFLFKIYTGKFTGIPYLTYNSNELMKLNYKCNNRYFIFKLISTYNNGNIFGVCILLFLPLYQFLEKNKLKQSTVILALILTLSRTVWVGLIFSEAIYFFIKKRNKISNLYWIVSSCIFSIFSFVLVKIAKLGAIFSSQSLFSLGFRLKPKQNLMKKFPLQKLNDYKFSEMIYKCCLEKFGIIGLIFFILSLTFPLFLLSQKYKITNEKKFLILGLITYLFISFSDGCYSVMPTICIYWFISSMLLLKKNAHEI